MLLFTLFGRALLLGDTGSHIVRYGVLIVRVLSRLIIIL